jgi:hypothetical protein
MELIPHVKTSLFQKLAVVFAFFIFAPLTLFTSLFSLVTLSNVSVKEPTEDINLKKISTKVLSSSDSDSYPSISSNIIAADGRPEILKNYLHTVNSELEPYAELMVKTADKYNLDFRLLTAIAIKESGACRVIPPESHNCWGWGIHSAGTLGFDSYEEAIEIVSKGLKDNYINKGYITPDQIMTKYAHKDSTTWGPDVSAYMTSLE